jgi:hypothetical protein
MATLAVRRAAAVTSEQVSDVPSRTIMRTSD